MPDDLTPEEARAIASLDRLAKHWPSSLKLFSWSGTLVVIRSDQDMERLGTATEQDEAILAVINGIPNDGGDP